MPKKQTKLSLKRKLDLDFKPLKRIRLNKATPVLKLATQTESPLEKLSNEWSSQLPDEILFKIFKYYSYIVHGDIRKLNTLKLVSKQWRTVASDLRLWHHIDMSKLCFKLSIRRVLNAPSFSYLTKLDLNNLKELTCDDLFKVLSRSNAGLRELNLANCSKIAESKQNLNLLKIIADLCPYLSVLNLTGMKVRQFDLKTRFFVEKLPW